MATDSETHVLDRLQAVIDSRHGSDPETSYTAKLLDQGPEKIAKKLGEEAVEAVIEGVRGDTKRLAAESADMLYHLLVLWSARGVRPDDVWQALEARMGTSGIEEKKARKKLA
ncbi:phosphoribosyl-ATP diphosphatase [Ferruginivarius sediminum]|uniref:Phosphoribosyl-ATP pyrophosphatase n=1 Tax=Ferruginivarius sediminum TaxID=2661937 RepID=A0A369TK50_9PROT|nr:phosphoribosyl-ATP diphosphatase [Ferruginivarius sediminum]RDD63296.1 phosphoribosyl-ATP diphosphatase [Ferruginivarius sediminum]